MAQIKHLIPHKTVLDIRQAAERAKVARIAKQSRPVKNLARFYKCSGIRVQNEQGEPLGLGNEYSRWDRALYPRMTKAVRAGKFYVKQEHRETTLVVTV